MMVESSRKGEVAAAGPARTRKLLNDHRERGDVVNLSVRWPEMSSTHFFGTVLRGTPRTPVGGERLDKHGALSDGPSALSGPLRPILLYPRDALLRRGRQKSGAPSRATLSAPYPFRFDRFNFVLMSLIHPDRRFEDPHIAFTEMKYSARYRRARNIAVIPKFV